MFPVVTGPRGRFCGVFCGERAGAWLSGRGRRLGALGDSGFQCGGDSGSRFHGLSLRVLVGGAFNCSSIFSRGSSLPSSVDGLCRYADFLVSTKCAHSQSGSNGAFTGRSHGSTKTTFNSASTFTPFSGFFASSGASHDNASSISICVTVSPGRAVLSHRYSNEHFPSADSSAADVLLFYSAGLWEPNLPTVSGVILDVVYCGVGFFEIRE